MVGSGIRKKPIPDPGSGGKKGTGSRIPDPDPQHCQHLYYKKARHAITPSDDLTPYRLIVCQIKSTDFETLTKQLNKTNQKCTGNLANPPLCINIRTLT
jgi:hypothetical protein